MLDGKGQCIYSLYVISENWFLCLAYPAGSADPGQEGIIMTLHLSPRNVSSSRGTLLLPLKLRWAHPQLSQ